MLATLPRTWGGVTAPGARPVVTEAESAGLPNAPFSIEHAFTPQSNVTLSTSTVTRDLVHRFFEHQMQIDGGKNDGYAAWSDAGGLALGHYDYGESALYGLAKEFVLADNFFQGAFGGSFLNHQYLICACAPEYPNADTASAKPSIAVLEQDAAGRYLPRLKPAKNAKRSALDEPPRFLKNGNITPANYFGDGKFYAVNTMQPAYQPSGNKPSASDTSLLYADPDNPTTLPPQNQATIGDALDSKHVNWIWYSGAWNTALADGRRPPSEPRTAIYAPATPGGNPDFQPHHQPFNYYERFDPVAHAEHRAAHLKDYDRPDRGCGRRPPARGGVLQAARQFEPARRLRFGRGRRCAYRRSGGETARESAVAAHGDRDHLRRVRRCVGSRRAAARRSIGARGAHSRADHFAVRQARHGRSTPYDTASILRLITRRFDLEVLPGITMRDAASPRMARRPWVI